MEDDDADEECERKHDNVTSFCWPKERPEEEEEDEEESKLNS